MTDDIIDQMVLKHIKSLPNLTTLDISNCLKITRKGIASFSNQCKSLINLRRNMPPLEASSPIDDSETKAMAETMPNLKQINLCFGRFGDMGLSKILIKCKSLTHLDIQGSWNVELNSDLEERRERRGADPDPTSKKTSRGPRLKSKAAKNKEKETQVEVKKRARIVYSQEEELILTESFIQIFEDPKTSCDQQKDLFWYKILDVYNAKAKKRGFIERIKNMLTEKWTPINASIRNLINWCRKRMYIVEERSRLDNEGGNFIQNPHGLNRFRETDEEQEHFGDDALPRPPGLQRLAKSQRSGSNSTASSSFNPMMYQEFMKEQYELDRKAKMQVIEQESKGS
uniref:Uncharacterized protein n=1 Tax=Tanacetum cinerariifolium TaxID=118510 RepID=A0A699H7J0_TANCI|nr:hypothetical protein [Tanacetum cinerariifolium]